MMDSTRLKQLLQIVLKVGNALHSMGDSNDRVGRRKVAHGFRLADLLRLRDTKALDGKTTLLEYTILTVSRKIEQNIASVEETFCGAAIGSVLSFADEMPAALEVAAEAISFAHINRHAPPLATTTTRRSQTRNDPVRIYVF